MTVKYLHNESLDKYTTFHVGGKADRVFLPETKNELIEILMLLNNNISNITTIGGGSNVLISSNGIKGDVIITKYFNNVTLIDKQTITAGSGVKMPVLSNFCLDNSLTGLEFMAGIPGTIGGAVKMNCSANGQAINDTLIEIELFDLVEGLFKTVKAKDLNLKYRKSIIDSKKQIVISAKFKLNKTDKKSIKKRIEENLAFRNTKQPKGFSAGSTFKNPKEVSSGLLLDKVGAKGLQEGGAEVSNIHANFITNIDNATSIDISRLMLRMRNAVYDKTGYKLHPEIQYIGEPTKEEEKIWTILKEL